ncbi:class I SAM-dependent methyltransferase [Mumia qirimensis]|uniref:class I SAM-dependent methyltransferase n=1 Tax=Mumia qirimensis TaxID=3234852 RepID=UPI00351D6741
MDLVLGRRPAQTRRGGRPSASKRVVAPEPPPNESGAPLFVPPGHYYSPIVDVRQLRGRGSEVEGRANIPGIELDLDAQAAVWAAWVPHVRRWKAGEGSETRRYHSNSMFGTQSARLLAGAIGGISPRRYIEIGSGFSSAVLLDVNDEWRPDDPIELTFIDPHPERLESLLRESDRATCTIITEQVQGVDLAVFDQLQSGDVLFIDSTHLAKTGSDVLTEVFEILPRVPVGAMIHLHDIPYPFDYPMSWLHEQNRSWNEAYFLRAFLMFNSHFRVHMWTDFVGRFAAELDDADSPELIGPGTSSIWLTRVAE